MRKGQEAELLHRRGTVNFGRLIDVRRDRLHACQNKQERQRKIAPDLEQYDHGQRHRQVESHAEKADLDHSLPEKIDRP